MTAKGLFISFEGIDGAGKSTRSYHNNQIFTSIVVDAFLSR